jgi:hypothetical protein
MEGAVIRVFWPPVPLSKKNSPSPVKQEGGNARFMKLPFRLSKFENTDRSAAHKIQLTEQQPQGINAARVSCFAIPVRHFRKALPGGDGAEQSPGQSKSKLIGEDVFVLEAKRGWLASSRTLSR